MYKEENKFLLSFEYRKQYSLYIKNKAVPRKHIPGLILGNWQAANKLTRPFVFEAYSTNVLIRIYGEIKTIYLAITWDITK